ncbi:FecR family protein [Spirosoma endbachense]|uniref:DUF4974 domain-containing protein n=1 Tax=Spirosoma endbachense TaxID=2666025 RepID=A0A6P1VZE1_9BACT|nr:FecR family protein [Spirosoma endbachense]QHV97140.1 DUF4974 domain-containing protein [Spirosoma endbachense]
MTQLSRCEDFVADSYFRQWVKNPDEASTLYWESYLADYPEKAEAIQQAIDLVKQIADATSTLAHPIKGDDEERIWAAIRNQIELSPQPSTNPFTKIFRRNWRNWIAIAASIAMMMSLGWWWLRVRHAGNDQERFHELAQLDQSLIEQTNDTDRPRLIALPDGSTIILQKGSQVTFSKKFNGPNRAVYLIGEAYFEVAKDPSRPFLVHANGLLTKVLGTSFTIRAFADDKDVVVTVRSGRVAVFPQTDKQQQQKVSTPSLDGIVLTHNQQIVFARQQARLIRTRDVVATTPVFPKGLSTSSTNFIFNATPVSDVFRELEKVYGVKIRYDKNVLGNCRLTADLTDESLSEKLTIICKSIEAEYQMQQLAIAVSGPGCQP